MKRRHLVVLVSAITLLTIVLVAAVLVSVSVGTDPGRERIRSIIQSQIAGNVNGKIHLGKISGGLLTGFTIDSFSIRDTEDSILVATGRVSVEYDPRDLMDRRILLRNVQVENPVIRLREYEAGDWNFQRVFRSRGGPSTDVPGRSFGDYVILDSVRVTNGTFLLTRPWSPDDSLTGARRDSAIRVNLANREREIRRNTDGLTHTYRWSRMDGVVPHARLAHPDSNRFGQEFVIASLDVDELEPPFRFRNARGTVRKLGDSVFVDIAKFDLPASTGSARGKIWWGSRLPIRVDVRVRGDSVSLRDVAWVYETLPREGGGRANLHIRNNPDNLRQLEFALSEMDVRSTRSRLTGAMTFRTGGPVLAVTDVDLRAAPVNFDLLRALAGEPLPVDWQGDLVGYVRGPGGPLTNFVVTESDVTFRDAHVRGAVSRLGGRGGLDILDPELTAFRGFDVTVEQLDLRSIEYLYPAFPRLGGTVAGRVTLDSSWLDVRFSNADVTHRNGPGEPTRVTGTGRITYGEEFLTYDVAVNAQPLSFTMMSRAYPLGLKGLMSGPISAKGTTNDLQLTLQLEGPAGRFAYNGRVDAYPLSVAARGTGRVESLDLAQLLESGEAPAGAVTGTYELDVRGDTNDLATLRGNAALLVERAELDGIRVFPSRLRARFADGRVYVDTLRVESVAATLTARGALGLASGIRDSLTFDVVVDSLGGLRRYVTKLAAGISATDSLAGAMSISGVVRGALPAPTIAGTLTGRDVFVRREAGRQVRGSFDFSSLRGGAVGAMSLRFDTLNVGGIALDTLGAFARFDGPAGRAGVFGIGARAVNGVTLRANGDIAFADSTTTATVRALTLATDSSRWALRGASRIVVRPAGLSIDSLVLANGRGGRMSVEGEVPDSGRARLFVRADSVPLSDVGAVAQLQTSLSGWATVTVQGAGTSTAPVLNAQATLANVRYGGLRLERVTASAEYLDRRAQVAVDLLSGGRPAVVARGSLPVEMQYFGVRLLEDSLSGTVRTDNGTFAIIEAFVPALRDATGRLVANIDVRGTWKHPDVAGALRVENGEVTVDALGVRMRGVQVDLALFGHRDSLHVRRLVAWSGTGPADSVSLSGYIAYRDLENPFLNLQLHARTFHALDKRSLGRLDVSTERGRGLQLRGRLRGATLTGGLVVDRGTIFLPDPALARKQVPDFMQLVDTTEVARRLLPAPPSKLLESILIDDVRVTLGDEVWIRSREANIKLAGALNVERSSRLMRGTVLGVGTLTGEDSLGLALDGTLRAERGTYTLSLGLVQREFQVEGGTLRFFPTPELAPEINVSAIHTVRTAASARTGNDLRIRVRITGSLIPNPIVTLESAESFALSQSDLVSYLIFGQPNFELDSERQSYVTLGLRTILPSVQSVAAAQLRSVLGSWADVVQLRPGSADPATLAGGAPGDAVGEIFWSSRLGVEKQIADNLFVSVGAPICQFNPSYSGGSDADLLERVSGRLEYRLSSDAAIKAGKEPSALVCGRTTTGRVIPTPSQWALSLFKSWRF